MIFCLSKKEPVKPVAALMTAKEYELNKKAGLVSEGKVKTYDGEFPVLIAVNSTHQTFEMAGLDICEDQT